MKIKFNFKKSSIKNYNYYALYVGGYKIAAFRIENPDDLRSQIKRDAETIDGHEDMNFDVHLRKSLRTNSVVVYNDDYIYDKYTGELIFNRNTGEIYNLKKWKNSTIIRWWKYRGEIYK